MFKLLSKESTIFSIPIYIGVLAVLIFMFDVGSDSFTLDVPMILALMGVSLGYFCINSIRLNYQTHIPLFLYTIFSFVFFSFHMDIGLSIALIINSLLLLMLSSPENMNVKKNYVMVGALLTINYLFLPPTWLMILFVIIHIFATSDRVLLCLFRLFFGMMMIGVCYFSMAYFLDANAWDERYIPMPSPPFLEENHSLLYLAPVGVLLIWAVIDHFVYYNQKSPISRYKYTFLLVFLLVQLVTLMMYMEDSKSYLLLIVIPLSIIFARFLRFRKKHWQRELGIGVIIINLVLFFIIDKVVLLH